jgi:methionine synthase II (cobalamin-independent)
MDSNDKISEALETSYSSEVKEIKKQTKEIQLGADKADVDFNLTRKNLKELIDRGSEAIDGILKIASEGDHPRAYEVAATLIKTVSEVNTDLMDLHKKMADMDKTEVNVNNTTNNAIYVGSTLELQDLINSDRSSRAKARQDVLDVTEDLDE